MNTYHSFNRGLLDSKFCHLKNAKNDLQIERVEYFSNKQKDLLVLLLESNSPFEREVKAFIKGNNLIIEAPCSLVYNKPFRTHLIEKEILSDYEKGNLDIGFSEVQLNQSFSYNILSWQSINPIMLKVILRIHPLKNNMRKTIN